ncbi:hypothetical protein [uncultured Salinisphaera sp.]|uniref:hypothetical protein n=1 Tax=uncultured Salinisphaera sp. TaxID=359372 RepID=UPI0032B30A94|tara:strand:- start:1724 stop:2140 length:417 start_codon:yes stop_codon:yes gene_type:complete
MKRRMTAACAAVLFLAGCASQKPVLYSASDNAPAGGDQAIAACQQRAEAAGLDYEKGRVGGYARGAVENGAVGGAAGAVGGAIYGSAARGAAAGAAGGVAAGLVRSLFSSHNNGPAPAYKAYVNRCLADRGYEPIGWN